VEQARLFQEGCVLKITLKGSQPPIWRRIIVSSTISAAELHDVIQAVMGWENCHLYTFEPAPRRNKASYTDEEPEWDKVSIRYLFPRPKSKITYVYDFGDNWQHLITFEKSAPLEPDQQLPLCIGGARACPLEDCGGAWRYSCMLAILADPDDEDYSEIVEWMGEDYDPEEFSIEYANKCLSRSR